MNGPNHVKMEQENAKKNAKKKEEETVFKDVIQTKFFIFPQFVDKEYEREYNMLRLFGLKEFITIHAALTLSIIVIQLITFFSKLHKLTMDTPQIFILIFLLINFFVHLILIIKIHFFTTKFNHLQYLFVATILINQVFQFIVLFLQAGLIYDIPLSKDSFNMYYNKFYLFIHFFIDTLLILCLPTLRFALACLFIILYILSNTTLIFLFKFEKVNHEEDFYYMAMFIVVLFMFLGLRFWMEKRNRMLLYMIKDLVPNSYKDYFGEQHKTFLNGIKTSCENETDSFTVDIPKQDRENGKRASSDTVPMLHDTLMNHAKNNPGTRCTSMLNDFSIDACYKDYFSVFFFLQQLLIDCKKREKGKQGESRKGIYNFNKEMKKNLLNIDILTVAYETKVLKNVKTVTSNQLGTNWDYSFIDSEYGNSTLVVLEVGYFLISPYIEPIESKKKKLQLFLLLINSMYFPNPYHNANHGATVCHLSKCLAHITEFDKSLNNTYMICYLVAAIAHDVGHPGRTNTYLTDTDHVLSIRYNDMSILENYHCSVTFAVLKLLGHDFLINEQDTKMTAKNNYSSIRKFIIELIIATDMKLHFEYVNIFKKRKKSCNFDLSDRDAINMGTINIKLADIGHTCLRWKDHAKWTMLVSEEFYAQKLREEAFQKEKSKKTGNEKMKETEASGTHKRNEFLDDIMDLNHDSIYMNYIDNINNVKDHIYANIKLNFIHSHDFVKNIPSTQVYFFEIIVLPLIQELQAMEKSNKDITGKVLYNLRTNLKTWKIIEKNINIFYNTEKLYCTDFYKKLKKNNQLFDTDLMDLNEEHIKEFSKNLSFGLESENDDRVGIPEKEPAQSLNKKEEVKKGIEDKKKEKEPRKSKKENNSNNTNKNKESNKRKSKSKNSKQ